MTKDERKHVDTVGLNAFNAAVDRAKLSLSKDRRLVQALKLREALSFEMALRATGFPERAFSIATAGNERRFGRATQEMQDIVDEHLNDVEVTVHAH
jgi:hypothetical protein